MPGGIIYEYEDGGSYCGEWEGDSSHGFGVCTGPKGEGTFEGQWDHGDQVSGVYHWPNGVQYSGMWEENMRHGMGVETRTDGTEYSGEFNKGMRGPFGTARLPNGVYHGQWANGAQDGEGVETYRDHGCYRGQYRKGVRSGFGTRSSAGYETRSEEFSLHTSNSEPALQAILNVPPTDSPLSPLSPFKRGLLKKQTDSSSSLKSSPTTGSIKSSTKFPVAKMVGFKEELAQVYEGEWVHDKRHGHGVLKVLTKYTYYGQWAKNAMTGYGVMVYENGSKQEGEWHNGTLIAVVKRHKVLLFKSHQLELKVKEARSKAWQAAETARHKAELAASRAASALAKSRLAAKVAENAVVHSQLAKEKAEMYKNAPRISESIKSPVANVAEVVFPSIDPGHIPGTQSMLSTSSSTDSSRLSVDTTMMPSSSFDDLRSVHSDSGLVYEGTERGSDSPGSMKRYFEQKQNRFSADEGVSLRSLEREERVSRMLQHNSSSEWSFDSPDSKRRSRRISDSVVGRGNMRRKKFQRSLSLSDQEEDDEEFGGRRSLRQRIDKRTGEVDQDVSDDEHERLPSSGGGARTSNPKDAVTIDMLNEMAKWNRMVAFVNFGLLVLLLFLILLVFASMYYYRLLSYYKNHPDPEDQTGPAGFLTPLA